MTMSETAADSLHRRRVTHWSRATVAALLVALVLVVTASATASAASRTRGSAVEFRPVLAALPAAATTSTTMSPADRVEAAVKIATCDVAAVQQLAVVPTTKWPTAKPDECVVYPDLSGGQGASRYYLGPAAVTTRDIERARAEFMAGQGWTVRFDLTKSGSRDWDALAEQQFHEQVAVTASGRVVSAPTIQPSDERFQSFDGTAVISGSFTAKQAHGLALLASRSKRR